MTALIPPKRAVTALDVVLPLEEAFCLEYITAGCTGPGKALERAYLSLDEKHFDLVQPSPSAMNSRAYQILRKPAVIERINELRRQAAQDARFTLMDHVQRLAHISMLAESQGDLKVALAAEIARGKAAGYQNDTRPPLFPVNNVSDSAFGIPPVANNPTPLLEGQSQPHGGKGTTIQNAVIIQSM